MRTDTPPTVHLADYRPYPYRLHAVRLEFVLDPDSTQVRATLEMSRAGEAAVPLQLDGEQLELVSIALNGTPLGADQYTTDDESLRIDDPGERFDLQIETKISPKTNTALSGLYMSGGRFCTQCEAEGFRRITYFPDRPDVLAPVLGAHRGAEGIPLPAVQRQSAILR